MLSADHRTRFISFDAEGTLATHAFSRTFMREVVPALYARKHGLGLEEATTQVFSGYENIGMQRREWYDIQHWFHWFGLGSPFPVIEEHRSAIEFYPEVSSVLESLSGRYSLVVASSTPFEFLRPLLRDVEHHFLRFFSATSQWGKLKDEEFFKWLCRELDAEPSEVVHVGDSWEHDFVGSSGAGIVAYHLDRSDTANGSLGNLLDLLPLLG